MNKSPVYMRVYFCPWFCEIVRKLRYEGLPDPAFWDFYRDLAQKHGDEKANAAYKEICTVDRSTEPATIRLTDECLRVSKPLLRGAAAQARAGRGGAEAGASPDDARTGDAERARLRPP